ncbi:TPA: LOW QUALITY PROTEIN: hypothetical protein N0F65_001680, partial [Lagenidium giganteum]
SPAAYQTILSRTAKCAKLYLSKIANVENNSDRLAWQSNACQYTMEAWVRSKVEQLKLDADVYVDYAKGILEDEDTDVDERVQSVIGIFLGACDGLVSEETAQKLLNETTIIDDVNRILADVKKKQKVEEELRQAENELRDLRFREAERKEAELAAEKEREKALARQTMSREELAQREKLISAYGFSIISDFDEDGNILRVSDKDAASANLDGVAQNTNRARVQQAQASVRESMKKEHEKKVARAAREGSLAQGEGQEAHHEARETARSWLMPSLAQAPAPTPPQSESTPKAKAPGFAQLVRFGLESIGVTYISGDHLRRAKKNESTPREYLELWRVLYDVVCVVLVDFDVDVANVRACEDASSWEHDLLDVDAHAQRKEIVRHYLYEWGFVGAALYAEHVGTAEPPSTVLLLALVWLFAHSNFFHRQRAAILSLNGGVTAARLPPYPNGRFAQDVVLDPATVNAVIDLVCQSPNQAHLPAERGSDLEQEVQKAHMAFGRLRNRLRDLLATHRLEGRLRTRIADEMENVNMDDQEAACCFYALQLLTQSKQIMDEHIRLLQLSVEMLEQEKLLYKWVNGLLLKPELLRVEISGGVRNVSEGANHNQLATWWPQLQAHISATQRAFTERQAIAQEMSTLYNNEWKKWKAAVKTATQKVRMQDKMEKLTAEIETSELFDIDKMFLQAKPLTQLDQKASIPTPPSGPASLEAIASSDDLERLKSQLQEVLDEITTQYCNVILI